MAIEFKFRGGARLISNVAAVAGQDFTLPGQAAASPLYRATAGTLVGVSSILPSSGNVVPAVLSYTPERTVWDFARADKRAADSNGENDDELTAMKLSHSIIITGGNGSQVDFVFAPGEAASELARQLLFTQKAGKTYQSGAPETGDLMAELTITVGATPWALSMCAGDLITDLVPPRDGVVDVGSAANKLQAVYADAVNAGSVIVGADTIKAAATAANEYALPGGTASGEGKMLATKDDIPEDLQRSEVGARSLRDLAASAVVPAAKYPLVGGAFGDLIEVLEFSPQSALLFAREYGNFGFIDDNNGARAFTVGQEPSLIGDDAERNQSQVSRINTRTERPADVPAFVDIHPCRIVNIGSGFVLRFGVVEGGSALDASINTVEKLRKVLANVSLDGLPDANPAIPGVTAAQGGVLGKLAVWGDFVRRDILQPLNEMAATADPQGDASEGGANATTTLGFSVGSQWFNRANKSRWICTSVSGADATWERFDGLPKPTELIWSGREVAGVKTLDNGKAFSDYAQISVQGSKGETAIFSRADFAGGVNFIYATSVYSDTVGNPGEYRLYFRRQNIQHLSDTTFAEGVSNSIFSAIGAPSISQYDRDGGSSTIAKIYGIRG